MNTNGKPPSKKEIDQYVYGMDRLSGELEEFELSNYRKYQDDLIARHIGKNILEVGGGDRSFTNQILIHSGQFDRIISIEPPVTLFETHKKKYKFPNHILFYMMDLFNI